MTTQVKDGGGNLVTRQTLDDMSKGAGASDATTLRHMSASDDPVVVALGGAGTGGPALPTASSGVIGWLRLLYNTLAAGLGVTGTVSVSNFPSSQAVTGTFWQATQPVSGPLTDTQLRATAVPVSLASAPLPTGAAADSSLSAINTSIGTTNTEIGGLTETAPATDTASSGLNGRLQRIAQRLSSMIALLPTALGAGGGLKIDGSGTALPVSGTFWQATQPVSAASLPLPTGAATETTLSAANTAIGATADAAVAAGASGSLSAKLRAISRDLVANIVLAAGSAVIGKVSIDQTTPGTTNLVAATGDVASGASDSGNPVKAGGLAKTALPTAVSDGQRVASLHDKYGRQIVRTAMRENLAVQQTQISNSTSETTIVTADASNKLDIYGLILANTGSTATTVTIKDATAGTTRAKIYVPAGDTRGFWGPTDSGLVQASANNNWTATCSAATTALEVTAAYMKAGT